MDDADAAEHGARRTRARFVIGGSIVETPQNNDDTAAKKPYEAPVLTEYGSVAKLTQAIITGSLGDGGVHPSNMRI
jgi:hypothetical protein